MRARNSQDDLLTRSSLKRALDRLYDEFNREDSALDPVQIVRRYSDPADREVVAFCAAALAFGRVASVIASIEALVALMTPSPAAFVREFRPDRHAAPLAPLVHRWIRGADLAALALVLHEMIRTAGSIEAFFTAGLDPCAADVSAALESFSARALAIDLSAVYAGAARRPGLPYFFPRPSSGSACKRLNLFLRWMVRSDGIDPGGWTRVRASQLVVPLDTHVIRVGRCLRLTRRVSPGWQMAREITAALRALDPDDPIRYDFSLCHLGMMSACGFNRPQRDRQCPLRGACHPTARTRPRSRQPSDRP